MTFYRRQGSRPSPRKRSTKKAEWLPEESLQIDGEKERYINLNAEFQRKQREKRKPSSVINAKKWRKTVEWERLEISSRNLEIPREHFMLRWAQ